MLPKIASCMNSEGVWTVFIINGGLLAGGSMSRTHSEGTLSQISFIHTAPNHNRSYFTALCIWNRSRLDPFSILFTESQHSPMSKHLAAILLKGKKSEAVSAACTGGVYR